jgi:hypothetical protein
MRSAAYSCWMRSCSDKMIDTKYTKGTKYSASSEDFQKGRTWLNKCSVISQRIIDRQTCTYFVIRDFKLSVIYSSQAGATADITASFVIDLLFELIGASARLIAEKNKGMPISVQLTIVELIHCMELITYTHSKLR